MEKNQDAPVDSKDQRPDSEGDHLDFLAQSHIENKK